MHLISKNSSIKVTWGCFSKEFHFTRGGDCRTTCSVRATGRTHADLQGLRSPESRRKDHVERRERRGKVDSLALSVLAGNWHRGKVRMGREATRARGNNEADRGATIIVWEC